MGKLSQVERLYRLSDAEMQEDAKTKRLFFIEDKADFVAFDADFDDPYAADWQDLIDAAEALPQDEVIDDELQQFTVAAEEAMQACRDKFQDSKFFIEKTFPQNESIWHEFGYDNYLKARRNQVLMIEFMKNLHRVATKYDTLLIAKGYLQPKIDEIETLRAALDEANQEQEAFMGNIPVKTRERHMANNEVWKVMVSVCTAGKRIYKDNYAKYQRYLLPPGDEDQSVLRVFGTVSESVGHQPLKNVVVVMEPGGYTDKTHSDGKFGFGLVPNGNYTLTFSCLGYQPQEINANLVNDTDVQEMNFEMEPI